MTYVLKRHRSRFCPQNSQSRGEAKGGPLFLDWTHMACVTNYSTSILYCTVYFEVLVLVHSLHTQESWHVMHRFALVESWRLKFIHHESCGWMKRSTLVKLPLLEDLQVEIVVCDYA